MSTIITRLFKDRGRANDAAAALAHLRLGSDAVRVIARESSPADADAATRHVADALAGLHVQRAAATAYAKEAVRTGGALVVVHAGFGRADAVLFTLNRFDPIEVAAPDHYVSTYSGAWFSEAFGLPTLSNNPAPLSRLLGLPLLTRGESNTQLSSNPAPFSSMLGLPVLKSGESNTQLSSNPAPFSSALGLPTLSKKAAPLSSMLGLPTLTRSKDSDY